jgi:hypothetical protein
MDTHRKFSFEKGGIGFPVLSGQKFTCATTDGAKGLSSELTLEGGLMDGVKTKTTANAGLSKYSTEFTLDMKKLAGVDGLKVKVTADQAQKASVKAEYTSDMASVSIAADPAAAANAAYSVGLAPMDGVNCGFSGKGAAPPTALALSYAQKGNFGCYLGLSGAGFSSVAARGIYEGLAGVNLAASVSLDGGAYKGATVGGTYEVDDSTTLKVVSTDALSLKAGLSKELAAGVTLTVGHAVDAAKIADTSAHTVGWTLEIK